MLIRIDKGNKGTVTAFSEQDRKIWIQEKETNIRMLVPYEVEFSESKASGSTDKQFPHIQ